MKKVNIILAVCGIWCTLGTGLQARNVAVQVNDSLMFSEKTDMHRRVDFDAMRFVGQKRYRPDYSKFHNKGFFDNMSIGVYGGFMGISQQSEMTRLRGGSVFGLHVGKYFSPYSGVRIGFSRSAADRIFDNEHWQDYGLNIEHMFNLTTYLSGFNPFRTFEIVTTEGLGLHYTKMGLVSDKALDAHVGVQLKVNTGGKVDFFIEPRVTVYTDGVDHSGDKNWHLYDFGYSGVFGLNYRMGYSYRSEKRSESEGFGSDVFLSFGGGLQTMISSNTRAMGLWRTSGPLVSASVGKWITDPVALRLSLHGSYVSWKEVSPEYDNMALYGGGRLELMLDPFELFAGDTHSKSRFRVIPFAGLEFGVSGRQGVPEEQKDALRMFTYGGFTGGLQFKYNVEPDLAIYLEPRYTNVPYFYGHKNYLGYIEGYNFADQMVSLSLGVEMQRWSKARYMATVRKSDSSKRFVPHFIFNTQFGGAWAIQQVRSSIRHAGHAASMYGGYRFNSVSGLEGGLELGTVYTRTPVQYRQISVSGVAHYLFDVANLFAGYDPERRWGAALFAGPVVTKVSQNDSSHPVFFGLEAGGRLSYGVSDVLDFYAEPKVRCYSSRVYPVGSGTPVLVQLNVGTSYRFGFKGWRINNRTEDGRPAANNWFVGASMGAVNTFSRLASVFNGEAGMFAYAMGPAFSVYAGKWLTPFWALRTSLTASYYTYSLQGGKQSDLIVAYGGGRVEGLFNPFALSRRGKDFKVELIPMGGLEFGRSFRALGNTVPRGFYTGLTVALQLKFHTSGPYSFYLEPRVTRLPNSYLAGGNGKQRVYSNDNLVSLSFGAEVDRPRKSVRNAYDKDFRPYNYVSLGVGFGSQISPSRYNILRVSPMFEIYGGRQFNPYSGLRLGYDYIHLSSKPEPLMYKGYSSLSLDYMWSLGRTFAGYDSDRRLDLEAFAGPVCTWGNGHNYWGAEVGARGTISVGRAWNLYIQPKGRFYGKQILPSEYRQKSNMMFSISVGTSYCF